MDAPVAPPADSASVVLAAETPASVFAALPLAPSAATAALVVAHEAARTRQPVWRGEEVNHQWGKGWEAEQLLDALPPAELLADVRYFCAARADPRRGHLRAARARRTARRAHPLVQRAQAVVRRAAPKCAYVWLQFAAHLPPDVVARDVRRRPRRARRTSAGSASCSASPSTRRSSASAPRPKPASRSRSRMRAARSGRRSPRSPPSAAAAAEELARPLVEVLDRARHAAARRRDASCRCSARPPRLPRAASASSSPQGLVAAGLRQLLADRLEALMERVRLLRQLLELRIVCVGRSCCARSAIPRTAEETSAVSGDAASPSGERTRALIAAASVASVPISPSGRAAACCGPGPSGRARRPRSTGLPGGRVRR